MQFVKARRGAVLALALLTLAALGCSSTPVDDGKVPITTNSDKARQLFVEARDLSEKLRGNESLPLLKQAVELDPDFAQAHLLLAQVSATPGEFFAALDKARNTAAKASPAEQLLIQATVAGVNGDQPKQEELLKQLETARPTDERVHTLLGNVYFGQQRWEDASRHYMQAAAIAPNYSPVYNQLGYAHRFNNRMDEAEAAFKKYIELTPTDPNPYDSYAELLMKLSRFEESIAQYEKALKTNADFPPSYFGIASNLNFMGRHQDAREKLQQFLDQAKNDGQRRAAYAGMAISAIDEGNFEAGLDMLHKMYDIAAASNDYAAMSGDVNLMGNVLLEVGRYADALQRFQETVDLQAKAENNSERLMALAQLNFHYDAGRVAARSGDLESAKQHFQTYQAGAEANQNTFQIWAAHQLGAIIALQEKNWDQAISHLGQSNPQNPYNLCLMAEAYRGKGDTERAEHSFQEAFTYNSVNNLNQSLARQRVIALTGKVGA